MNNTISTLITDFFIKLGIDTTSIRIDQIGDDIKISVETPDSAFLIGMHGKNIEIFQHLLSRMIERIANKFVHVHLEVNDYIKQKDEKLHKFLDSKVAIITGNGQAIRMPSLTAYERKKAHGYISDKNIIGLTTKSEGEGINRALVLSYTGELIKKPVSPPAQYTNSRISNHKEMYISDEGVGI